jgi:hypothetical protein
MMNAIRVQSVQGHASGVDGIDSFRSCSVGVGSGDCKAVTTVADAVGLGLAVRVAVGGTRVTNTRVEVAVGDGLAGGTGVSFGGFSVGGTLVGGTLVGGTEVGGTEVGGTLVGGTLVGGTEVGGTEVGGTLVGGTLVGGTEVGGTEVLVGFGGHCPFEAHAVCGAKAPLTPTTAVVSTATNAAAAKTLKILAIFGLSLTKSGCPLARNVPGN